ncbi:hypothetical protein ACWKYD_06415 [Enterobacter cloacae]
MIASVWMTRILQQPELIKARYVEKYDEGYGLTADNGQLSEWLRKGERADEADFRLVTQLMQSELEEALRWTPAVLTPAWRQKLAWRLAEHRLSTAEMYILDELPSYTTITATQKQKSLTFTDLFEHYTAHIRLTDKDRAESRIRDYTSSANRSKAVNSLSLENQAKELRARNSAPAPCGTSSCTCLQCSGSHSKTTCWMNILSTASKCVKKCRQ